MYVSYLSDVRRQTRTAATRRVATTTSAKIRPTFHGCERMYKQQGSPTHPQSEQVKIVVSGQPEDQRSHKRRVVRRKPSRARKSKQNRGLMGAKNNALQPDQQQPPHRKKRRPYLKTPVPLFIGLCDPLPSPRAVAIAASVGGSSTPASSFRTLRRTLWWASWGGNEQGHGQA